LRQAAEQAIPAWHKEQTGWKMVHDSSTKGPAPAADDRRAGGVGAREPSRQRTGGSGGPREGLARRGRWRSAGRRRPGRGPSVETRRSAPGGTLQPGRARRTGPGTRGWPRDPIWGCRAGTDPQGVSPGAGSRAGRHGDLVAHDVAASIARGARWSAAGEHVDHLMGAVECRVHVARESNLVPHGRRRPSAQGRHRSRHHPQKT